jgi:hypothetical protein
MLITSVLRTGKKIFRSLSEALHTKDMWSGGGIAPRIRNRGVSLRCFDVKKTAR